MVEHLASTQGMRVRFPSDACPTPFIRGAGQTLFSSVIPQTHTINYGVMDTLDHKTAYLALAGSTLRSARGQSAAFDSNVKNSLENKALAEVGKK